MINTNCMTTKYHSNQLNRRERVLQTMVKYDPELYKEIIQYLKDDNYYNPLKITSWKLTTKLSNYKH